MPTPTPLRMLEIILKNIYLRAARNGQFLSPDDAMKLTGKELDRFAEEHRGDHSVYFSPGPRYSHVAIVRRAHHFAVELHYRTYFPQKRGAPKLPQRYVEGLLQLAGKKLSYGQIARRLGLPADLTTRDRLRKQIASAKRK